MLKKIIPFCSFLALVSACSHHPNHPVTTAKKTSPHSFFVSKSWVDAIKTKKPTRPVDQRSPASKASVPGFKEFMEAVKANPAVFKVPVGFEVTKESTMVSEGQDYKESSKTVYLKQNDDGYFTFFEATNSELEIFENDRFNESDRGFENLKEIQKISAHKYKLILQFNLPDFAANCEVDVDLTISSELFSSICKDASGKTISQERVTGVKAVDLKSYKEKLKSVKAIAHPLALECTLEEQSSESPCYESIMDESAKDWSYIL